MKKLNLLTCCVLALATIISATACSSTKVEAVNPIVNVDGVEVSSYIRTWPLGSTPEQKKKNKHWSADDVKGEYLTELIVAFAHIDQNTWGIKFPDADGELGKFPKLWKEVAKIQAKYPHLKMHVSIGGYGADGFSEMSADETKRATFVKAVIDLVREKNLDGIDIDWEYPIGPDWGQEISCSPNDGKNFIKLLEDLRAAFDDFEKESGRYISLSIAAPASGWYVEKLNVKKIASIVDSIKLMTYDYYGGWSGQAGHCANLYTNPADPDWGGWSTDATVKTYLNAGVPAKKIVLGLAFYGRAWKGVKDGGKHGLYQKYEEVAYPDGLSWSDMGPFLAKDSGYIRYWDKVADAPYLYNGDEFISYTDPEAVRLIGEYARKKGLGGVMVWEYGHDINCDLLPVLVNSVKDPVLFEK